MFADIVLGAADESAAAAPRIEHGAVISADLVDRIAALGVAVCLQPSFAVTDAEQVPAALGPGRSATAYPWQALAAAGVPLLAGTDYPIEIIDPLAGLSRLVRGRSDRAGYGTEATRLTLDYAFTALGLHSVLLKVYAFNLAGLRTYQKAGFREIGRRREAHHMGGRLWDVILMDCLATDFARAGSSVLSAVFAPDPPRD